MLGLSTSLVKGGGIGRQYVKDGLKLYMPYKGADTIKGTQFVGTGSTSFDGTNDYISLGDTATLSGLSALTISAWINTNNTAADQIVCGKNTDTDWDDNSEFAIQMSGADIIFAVYDIDNDAYLGRSSTGNEITAGQWHHVTCTWDGSTTSAGCKIYIDGVQTDDADAASGSGFVTIRDTATPALIGARWNDLSASSLHRFWNGELKNVAIWNRALTATEVQNVMYKTYVEVSGRLASGLVSWWALDVDYTDYKGSNDGTNSGSTLNTDLYGGDTPVIPRAIDNAPTVQADAIGAGSALFNGTSDVISTGQFEDLFSGGATMLAWIKPSSDGENSEGRIFDKSNNVGADDGPVLMVADESSGACDLRFMHGHWSAIGNWSTTSRDVTIGEWNHVAVTYNSSSDSNNPVLYVNGISSPISETASGSGVAVDSNHTLYIGNNTGTERTFDGNICQSGIWKGALTQEKIQAVMEKTFEELTATEKSSLGAELITNAGASGQTDWVDSNGDGEADDWGGTNNPSIVTGNGFTGNAQRDEGTGGNIQIYQNSVISNDILYKFSLKYRSSDAWVLYSKGGSTTIQSSIPANTGDAIEYTRYIQESDVGGGDIRLYIPSGAGKYLEIDEISCKAVTNDLVSYWALDETVGATSNHVADLVDTSLGTELFENDYSSGIGAWDNYGTNPVTNDDGAIKIAYEDNANGALLYLKNDADLTSDLTVGQVYKLTMSAKVSTGSVNILVNDGSAEPTVATITSTSYVDVSHYFTAYSATSCRMYTPAMTTGEIIWLDNISLKPVDGNYGTLI